MTSESESRPLRVALNLLFLGERAGGVGRYSRALPGALLEAEPQTEVHVIVSRAAPGDLADEPWAGEVRWIRLPTGNVGWPLVVAQYLAAPVLSALHRVDIIHSPANVGPVITPGVASVVSLMDVIWLIRPDEWETDPAAFRAMHRQVSHSVRDADRVFAISEAGASDIAFSLPVAAERIVVTPLGVTPPGDSGPPAAELRRQLELDGRRVILCVAQKRPYKNLHTLIAALPELPEDIALVIPGSPTGYEDQLRALAESLGVQRRVRLPAWLPDPQLETLYELSEVFVLPSLIEGFGLPVLEAMVRRIPVACSDIGALREVAGDAALLFDPQRQDEVTAAIQRLLEDRSLAERLANAGRERARQFTWRRTGEVSLAGYREAIASRRR